MSDTSTTEKTQQSEATSTQQPSWFSEGLLRNRRILIILVHITVFMGSMFFAFLFAFNMNLERRWFFGPFLLLLIFALPIKLLAFGFFGQYRGWWRYVGISDLIYIAKAAILSAIIIMILWFAYGQFGGLVLPRSWTEKLSKRIEPLERLQVQIKLVDRGLNNLSTNQGQYKDNIRWTTDGIDRHRAFHVELHTRNPLVRS